MIGNISSWAQGIIIAIIVGSIIKMILPENKNKKYINVVIGVYILFSILSPVVGKNMNISDYNLEEYLNVENGDLQESNNIYDDNIKNIFKNKVTTNIESQLKLKGYKANNIEIEIDDNCNILKIKISEIYENKTEEQHDQDKKIVVNSITTNVNTVDIDIKQKPAEGMAISDKNDLIKYLNENYGIDKKNIIIE